MTGFDIQGVDVRPMARLDLRALVTHIGAEAGRAVAQAYVARIARAFRLLQDFPLMGQARPEFGSGVRSIAVERHTLIVYLPAEGRVQILRVLHGGQDAPDQLFS
jgi:toxin ParE1/3/4